MMNEIVNVFDFNFVSPIGHNLPITDRKGVTNAFRTNHFLSAHELSSRDTNSTNAFTGIKASIGFETFRVSINSFAWPSLN